MTTFVTVLIILLICRFLFDVERKRYCLQILRMNLFLILINIQEGQMAFLYFANLIEQPMMNLLCLRLVTLNVILCWYIH